MRGEREECEELLLEAGWVRDGGEFRHPDGQRVRHVDRNGRTHRHLHLSLADRPIAFALEVYSYDLAESIALAGHCHAAVSAGAAVPWLVRAQALNPLWIIGADGGRHKVAPSVTSARRLAAGDAVAVLVETLAAPPRAAATARAEDVIRMLEDRGWKDTTGGRAKAEPGRLVLRRARWRDPAAGEHNVSYVLTGDPVLPEALRWHGKLADGTPWGYLVGAAGATAVLPGGADRVRPAEVTEVLARAVNCRSSSDIGNTAHALAAITAVNRDSARSMPIGFGADTLPRRPAPALSAAVAGLRAEPESGEAWLDCGFAALTAGRHHLAVAAFAGAAERGAGGGLPLLWRGWLRRHLDPAGAVADLDRAAEASGITGEARLRQAMIHDEILGDTERELTALEQGTAQDPDHVGGWERRGLALAKHGRPAEAVDVLTLALERHATATLWHYLGYAALLTGDPESALEHLEQAVRLDESFAPRILADPDLAPLRDEPRFTALPRLAGQAREQRAEERRQAHLDHRRSLRPARPLPELSAGLGTLRAVYKTHNVHGVRVRTDDLPAGITDPELRELLTDYQLGVPYRVASFSKANGRAPEPYEEDPAAPLPLGLGAGLYHLGDLGDGDDEVAVDGRTGEVFLVELDRPMSYLAPSLAAFLIDECVPEGEHVWDLSGDDPNRLDRVHGIGAGRLRVFGHRIDTAVAERLTKFIAEHGDLLHTLLLTGTEGPSAGLGPIDFAAACPNLRRLHLHNGQFDDSVLRHPSLEQLNLRQATYAGGVREFRLTADTPLRSLYFEDCVFDADTLYAGPDSVLEGFGNTLDEDYGGTFPERLEFHGAKRLRGIQINCGGAYWKLVLRGELPALTEVRQDAQPYGSFDYAVEDAAPADRKRYFSMIRKGKDYTKRW